MTLGELIQEYRKEHGMSQRQFAIACQLSNGYISMLERGENPKTKTPVTPTLPALQKIAQGLGISLTELFVQVDDMPVDLLVGDQEKEKLFFLHHSEGSAPVFRIIEFKYPHVRGRAGQQT